PFFHALSAGHVFPSFLTFFHEPFFQVIQVPVIFLGATQVFVRLPNELAAILIFVVLYLIGRKLFGENSWYVFLLLLLYTVNGFFKVYRAELNHSFFNLAILSSYYFLIQDNFGSAYKLALVSCFIYIDGGF